MKEDLVIIVTACLLLVLIQQQRIDQEKQKVQQTQQLLDSLKQEQLPLQIELGRYQVALEILRDQDKKAAETFEYIMSNYTE